MSEAKSVIQNTQTPHEAPADEARLRRRATIRNFLRNKNAVIGSVITLTVIFLAMFAPVLSKYHPTEHFDLDKTLLPPGSESHILGTDTNGRDLWSRMLYGARISLTVGIVVQSISLTIGTTVGLISGYTGGVVDEILSGMVNVIYSFPSLLFAIATMAVLGPSIYNIFLALGFIGWATVARLVRGEVLSLRSRDFVEAARASGVPTLRLMFRHLLPNCLGPIVVVGTLGVASAIMSEATLSFLGLGIQPPTPSWGSMLSRGREYIWVAPWLTVIPGVAIFVTVLGLNLLGDGLRDMLDPRLRE